MKAIQHMSGVGWVFVIGGAHVYTTALQHKACRRIFLTRVESASEMECDTYFPLIDTQVYRRLNETQMKLLTGSDVPLGLQTEKHYNFEFTVYEKDALLDQ